MHGFMSPADVQALPEPTFAERAPGIWRRYKWFTIVVLLPTLLLAIYLYGFASDQYVSEAHYLVRTQSSSGNSDSSSGGKSLGGLLGGGGASSLGAAVESLSVADYLSSHDVVDSLQRKLDIVGMWRRPEADLLSRLPVARPTPEFLRTYYDRQVEVYFDTETGITSLKSRAFRPQDAYAITRELLQLGEQRINQMNERAYRDAVSLSKRQLDEAERALRQAGRQVTSFRQTERDADPSGTAAAQIGLVSRLQQELSAAKSQLATTQRLTGPSSPQVDALRSQIASLEQQLSSESSRLAGGGSAIAAGLGDYEALQTQQQFLQQRYAAAATTYEQARQQAVRQQLYLTRVVDPNMPVKSIYPRRLLAIATLFAMLLVVYAIGWLVAAGVREHSA